MKLEMTESIRWSTQTQPHSSLFLSVSLIEPYNLTGGIESPHRADDGCHFWFLSKKLRSRLCEKIFAWACRIVLLKDCHVAMMATFIPMRFCT